MESTNKGCQTIEVLEDNNLLSEENLSDIVGGTSSEEAATACTCDCFIGNTNNPAPGEIK